MDNDLISRSALRQTVESKIYWGGVGLLEAIDDAPTVNAVVLPCKVGDTVWIVGDKFPAEICAIKITEEGTFFEYVEYDRGYEETEVWDDGEFQATDIGKTVFLTPEEAEAVFAKMEKEGLPMDNLIDPTGTPPTLPHDQNLGEVWDAFWRLYHMQLAYSSAANPNPRFLSDEEASAVLFGVLNPGSGVRLTPSWHGEDCLGNGEHPGVECCCDECDHYLTCFPDWKEHT